MLEYKKSGKSVRTTPINSSVTNEEIAKIAQVSPAQRVAIAKKYEDSIRAVAKERQAESLAKYHGNQHKPAHEVCYSDELDTTPVITQNEIAKIAQVSPAQRVTIAKKYEDSIRAVAKENMSKGGQATPTRVIRPNNPSESTITQNEVAKISLIRVYPKEQAL